MGGHNVGAVVAISAMCGFVVMTAHESHAMTACSNSDNVWLRGTTFFGHDSPLSKM